MCGIQLQCYTMASNWLLSMLVPVLPNIHYQLGLRLLLILSRAHDAWLLPASLFPSPLVLDPEVKLLIEVLGPLVHICPHHSQVQSGLFDLFVEFLAEALGLHIKGRL